ncbi:hypothetical protein Tco_0994026 [Tanacetum coccineum]
MNPSTKNPVVPYPHFTKLITDHILKTYPDIPKRLNKPHHLVVNDDVVYSIFASRNSKGRGMGILDYLLLAEIMQTKAYKVYVADFKLVVPMTQPQPVVSSQGTHRTTSALMSPNPQRTPKKKKEKELGELSVAKNPLKITIKRRQPDPEAPIPTAKHIDIENMTEAQQLNEDVNKIVEGDDSSDVAFVDSILLIQEDPNTMIDLGSDKKISNAMEINYVATIKEEEGRAKAALIWKKGKSSIENMRHSFVPKSHIRGICEQVDKSLEKRKHARTKSEFSSQVSNDLAANVPQMMKNDPQSQVVDSAIWNALKEKVDKSSAPPDTCRPKASRERDHDDHPDGHPKGEKEYDGCSTVQEIDDDEDISKEAIIEFLAEIHGNKWVPTTADFHRMKLAYDDIMRSQYETRAEYEYHIHQVTNYINSQIMWESRDQDLTPQVPKD